VPRFRIVLDAGHGGWDLGTVGRKGLLEKDLVLDIAQRLGAMLQNRLGSEVIYTRQDDSYISLDQRADVANQAQADMFVSIHANYSDLESARGVETYYTNFFSPPESKEIEKRENGNVKKAVAPASLSTEELQEKIDGSRLLAASVQKSLFSTLSQQNSSIRNRGVKRASFVVLTGTAMPSILAEVSFVSSPSDEEKLQMANYRQRIADALYKGIARYAANSHRVKMASASGASTGQ
jgi:N-acetylmuramoyl-L-alanine amidase